MACAVVMCGYAMPAHAVELKSGLEVGDRPRAFHVTDVTGPAAGDTLCYRCKYGGRPVVTIFIRRIDENVSRLIAEVDLVVGKNREDKRMAAFVVKLSEDRDAAEEALKNMARKSRLRHTPLTIFDGAAGPRGYNVAKDAEVTVMMWVDSVVRVNHAFTHGQLDKSTIAGIVNDTEKILN